MAVYAGAVPGYREYAPPAALAALVECFWTSVVDEPTPHRVLPDGCVDFLFDLSSDQAADGLVIGTMTRPLDVPPARRVRIVAARFRPGGAFRFLGRPVSAFTDQCVSLDEVWPVDARLEDDLLGTKRPEARVARLAAELERRLPDTGEVDLAAAAAVRAIERDPVHFTVGAFSERTGISRQHLTRRFKEAVGVGPKVFARVHRARRLLARIEARGPGPHDWAALALDLGYADQSHMIAELHALVGSTPVALAS